MTWWRRSLLSAALLLSLAIHTGTAFADEAKEQAARLQQLRERISSLKNELGDMRGRQAALQRELESTDKSIGEAAAGMRQLKQQKAESQARLDQLEEERRVQRAALQEMRSRLAQDLRSAYLMGRQEQVKLLLNQEDPATVSRMLAYHGYFTRSRNDRIQALRTTLAGLAVTGQDIIAQQERLDGLLQQQHEVAGQLADGQDERSRVLATLQLQMKGKAQELAQLERDEQRRHISMQYGSRQAGGKLISRGVRIKAQAGADVRAIAKGRVAYADWLRGFGLLLIIDHGKDYMSLYGNNQTLFKEVGEWVEGNEVIATVGSSGGQASAGLYLELRKKGRPFNPAPWFAGKPSATRASR
jgi:septal ring factor EnvC (AmiA/AmiB activator)